jgi:hypothetical protein
VAKPFSVIVLKTLKKATAGKAMECSRRNGDLSRLDKDSLILIDEVDYQIRMPVDSQHRRT